MAISHPLAWRQQNIAAKAETTNGTPISLAAAEGVFIARDTSIDPAIEANVRESPGSFSMLRSVPGGFGAEVRTTTELSNSGSATHPQQFSVLLIAAGFTVSTGTYTVVSGSSTIATCTFGWYVDGLLYSAAGCMFDLEMVFESGRIIPMNWTGRGIWQTPADTAMITPTYPTANPPVFKGATLTWGGTTLVVPRMVIRLGNEVVLREDGASASGFKSAYIVNRNVTVEVDVEASLLATYDPYTLHSAMTEVALSCAVGSGSNGVVTIAAPKLQHRTPPRLTNRNGVVHWTFDFGANKNAAAGDDELTLTLS